ncbi:MAG: phospholipid carrier-dependent glycosyltransferase, partial [Planctomycetota bacterium]
MKIQIKPLNTPTALLLLFTFGCLLFFTNLHHRDLWAPDEPRFAQVAREMLNSKNLLIPHVNQQPYLNKPPLYFWTETAFGTLRGDVDEVAARLPSALAALAGILLTYYLSYYLFHCQLSAILSALILATSYRYLWQAQYVMVDTLFSTLVLASITLFYTSLPPNQPHT